MRAASSSCAVLSGLAVSVISAVCLVHVGRVPVSPAAPVQQWPDPSDARFAERGDFGAGFRTIAQGRVKQPESVIVDGDGAVCGGSSDGFIWKVDPSSGHATEWAFVGGRPLGLAFDKDGHLLVCEPTQGLIRVDKHSKQVTVVAKRTTDLLKSRIVYANDVDVAPNGDIYFSDATNLSSTVDVYGHVSTLHTSKIDLMFGYPAGRLLRVDPATGDTRIVIDQLQFANGVAVAHDGSFVLVAETYGRRVWRVWLAGDRRGVKEVFVDELPGFPDGVSKSPDGTFWVAIISEVPPSVPIIVKWSWVRQLLIAVPGLANLVKPMMMGMAIQLDATGRVLQTLYGKSASSTVPHSVSSVAASGTTLFIGSLHDDGIGVKSM
ncbi:SMP-30/Gluconolactonase/LRE-like region domain-containing protein [Plasmodiophora brassicae]